MILVTGASSGIGRQICLDLLREGEEIHGMGRSFPPEDLCLPRYHPHVLDLRDTAAMEELVRQIRSSGTLTALIHCAGLAWYGPHEEIAPSHVRDMVRINLELPMLLTSLCLRDLRKNQGTILFLSSACIHAPAPHGAAYAACKAGLAHFADSLFQENRRHGVRVITLEPDLTDTYLYRNADFEPMEPCLTPEDVSACALFALHHPRVLTHMTLQPPLSRIRRKPIRQEEKPL